MAEDNINSFTINILLIGFLFLGLISFFVLVAQSEGRGEIFDNYSQINTIRSNFTNQFGDDLIETANINSNLSADYNPELAISAADQSGNAIGVNLQFRVKDMVSLFFSVGGIIFGNVFSGLIAGLLIAFISYTFTYYLIKWIRSGL